MQPVGLIVTDYVPIYAYTAAHSWPQQLHKRWTQSGAFQRDRWHQSLRQCPRIHGSTDETARRPVGRGGRVRPIQGVLAELVVHGMRPRCRDRKRGYVVCPRPLPPCRQRCRFLTLADCAHAILHSWANFWPTAARRLIASFTGPLYTDDFYLIVPRIRSSQSFIDALAQPFRPFTAGLWVLIFAVFGLVGIAQTWSNDGGQSTLLEMLPHFPSAFVKGWHAFNAGEIPQVPVHHIGSWLTQFVVGFTKTVILTGYTALTVSSLLTQSDATVTSFADAISSGFRFCANANMVRTIVAKYPSLTDAVIGVPKADILISIDRGVCEAAIMDRDQWREERLWGKTHHCTTKVRLPEVIISEWNTIVVHDELAHVVSWAVRDDLEAGRYDDSVNEALQNYTAALCPEAQASVRRIDFGVNDLGALLVFLLFVATISLLINHFGSKVETRRAQLIESSWWARARQSLDRDGDGHIGTLDAAKVIASRISTRRRKQSRAAAVSSHPSSVQLRRTSANSERSTRVSEVTGSENPPLELPGEATHEHNIDVSVPASGPHDMD